MKCLKCNNEIKSNLNITFCRVCGEKIELNNQELNQEELKLKLDEYIQSKEYDLALELAYNLNDDKLKYSTIIELFNLYDINKDNVINNYAFKNEYRLEAYKNLLAIEPNEENKKEFEAFKENYIQSLNDSISSLKKGINQKKIELEKLNSMNNTKKIPYFNQILVGCIVTIILGIILGFVCKGEIINIIGYILATIGVITTIIVAYKTPAFDLNRNKAKVEAQIELNKKEINEIQKIIDETI